jgi:hypothetical protein
MTQTLDGDYSLFHAKPYVKHLDASNDVICVKIKKGGEIVERELVLQELEED